MMSYRRRKRKRIEETLQEAAELNIMPFIDVFSVLTTFLLFSAVFIAIGIIKVQVPFFTNKEQPDKPKRTLSVKVDVRKDKMIFARNFSLAPRNAVSVTYNVNVAGYLALHKKLVESRSLDKENDLVTLFSDDDVTFEQLSKVLDTIKFRKEGDPVFLREADDEKIQKVSRDFLYPKVVMGSVIL